MTVVLGPLEFNGRERAHETPSAFTVLAHPGLAQGEKQIVDRALSERLRLQFGGSQRAQFDLPTVSPLQVADYTDPFLRDRWLAAFAPVGGTGHVVVVQTRDSAAMRPNDLLRQLGLVFAALSAVVAMAFGAFWAWQRRAERRIA
jgi:hypothetical protein